MERRLIGPEKQLLEPIFKNMVPYNSIKCKINTLEVGGPYNSITPAGHPMFSKFVYCNDFTKAALQDQWVFFHEFTHVWQWHHDIRPVVSAIGIFISKAADYLSAYPYTVAPGDKFSDFNIEQQAAIVADYWYMAMKKQKPLNNTNPKATVADYADVMKQFQLAGPPVNPLDDDFLGGGKKSGW